MSQNSRKIRDWAKNAPTGREKETGVSYRVLDRVALNMARRINQHPWLREFLGADRVLIPIPRSAPLQPGALWPTREICEALVHAGLGAEVAPVLVRSRAVQKSAYAASGQRATPQGHFDSMEVVSAFPPSTKKITLVDDIITRGATFIGSYPHIAAAFPSHQITCFALIRTMSSGEIESFVDPIEGTITHRGNYLHREP